MPVVDELITTFGLKADNSVNRETAKISRSFNKIKSGARALSIAIAGIGTALSAMGVSSARTAEMIRDFSEATGLSTSDTQELAFAAQKVGASIRSVRSDILNLTKSMNSPIPGEYNSMLLMLGVRAKDAQGVLLQLSDIFKDLNAQQATQLGARLGLSRDTIKLLRRGRAEINLLRKEANQFGAVVSPEQINSAIKFNETWRDTKALITILRNEIGLSFLPALSRILVPMREFLLTNREIIGAGISRFFKELAKDASFLAQGFKSLASKAQEILGTKGVIAVGLLALIPIIKILSKTFIGRFGLAGAAISAVVLIVDDLIKAFQGGESIIGGWFDTIKVKIGDAFEELEKFWNLAKEIVKTPLNVAAKIGLDSNFFGLGGLSQLPQVSPSSGLASTNSSSSTVNITQNINGAGNPNSVAQEVVNRLSLGSQLQVASPGSFSGAVS